MLLPLTLLATLALAQDAPAEAPTDAASEASAAEAPADATDRLPTPAELAPWAKSYPGRVTPDSPHYDLEVLYYQGKNDEGLAIARQRMAENPSDPDPYWHALRFMYEQGERFERTDTSIDKEAHYKQMADYAEQGLAIDPDNPHLLFGKGIALGRLGTTRGVLASLFMAKDVEGSWKATLDSGFQYAAIGDREYLPCDAHQALAIYYRLVPDWWIVQAIAGTRGSIDKALDHATKADQCAPSGIIRVKKELGVAQICYGQHKKDEAMVQKGIATLEAGRKLPQRSTTEEIDVRHMGMIIADPDMACEYSRDGQQDLDEEKLKK